MPILCDIGMEAAVLGMLLRYPDRIHDCGVGPDHFYEEAHKRVVRAFHERGVSLASASSALYGDEIRAMELAESAFSDAGLEQHLVHLSNLADFRKIDALSLKFREDLEETDPSEIAVVSAAAAAEILAAISGSDDTISYGDGADEALVAEGGELMQTFLELLPVCRKELIGIAARPGCGKTTMAHLLGEHFSSTREGECFGVFTMEVTRKEWFQRTIRTVYSRAIPQYLGDGQKNRGYVEAAAAVKVLYDKRPGKLAVDDKAGLTLGEIRARALRLKAKHGRLSGIAIDQLSNIRKVREKGMTESTAIKNCTEGAKMLARELDCPVFLLSQFNRDPSGDNGWYTERDIYGSDGLLQDADQLWLLQNPPGSVITDGSETRRVNLRRVKWRNGTLGEMDLDFHTPSSKFYRTI